jgi:hypothetical protein
VNGRRDDSSARWNAALPPDICAFADRIVSPRRRRSTFDFSARCSVKPIRVIRGSLPYWLARTALNVPCFEGPSPTSGEKSTSPVIKSGVSSLPLHVNVPASRPTLPI